MKRFLSTARRADNTFNLEVWEVCDVQETGDFLHIRRLVIIKPEDLGLGQAQLEGQGEILKDFMAGWMRMVENVTSPMK